MNLIIDIGNTSVKIAVGKDSNLLYFYTYPFITVDLLDKLHNEFPNITHSIVSNVSIVHKDVIKWLEHNFIHIDFNCNTPVPIKNNYKTPETLGLDRLAAAVGSNHIYPYENVLSIDIGTCIKYDLINAEGCYLGGGIAPGLQMRLQALHNFTARLPLITYHAENIALIGDSTEKSVLSGVINGIIAEINGIIEMYSNAYTDLKVILTGGDANHFEKKIKSTIFALPNLTIIGLHKILSFNNNNQR